MTGTIICPYCEAEIIEGADECDVCGEGLTHLSRRIPASSVEADLLRVPIKKTAGRVLTVDQQAYNAVHGALRALGERANSLIKTTFKALRRWRGCPWRIGDIVAAALVLLHHESNRTT